MLEIAESLAAPFPFVRVDLFVVGDAIYVGELTFVPANGRTPIRPWEWELSFGEDFELRRDYLDAFDAAFLARLRESE